MPSLILASSSPYRRELLTRLRLPFECASPDIDESHRPGESAEQLVRRLSASKAEALAGHYPQHLIIGSDQVAVLDDNILGKPHTVERAVQQLLDASGRSVTFLTGLALLDSRNRHMQVDCIPFTVHFRQLDEARIRRYVEAERPLDCAGSFKAEGLGVSLFRATEGEDSSSLVGLPLIRLVDMLLAEGVEIP
ncbi:septum formation inhibitor Maf [Pseudomonas aeruginosa]|uniref:7-methyl-GTP pyrophosphatase n=1 Tax=Pseudomonas paraeruginosa (strain DSM 24068 / PA7) TaxID=381754 RepID=A6V3C6_PSEP7|nr:MULTISPECIES: nucleoside triphosphate pyrophosphatase [Pseudomonas aeruginosa group]ABR83372.1 septum formation protein Maf [Pseudomonas aeruginosa PA7]KSC83251.1 septum formation inhibitor Maf [Pseudomonas aeruginosa]KSD16620.1 septum formation inhibitor Maf [Pseudomonas aeruginosa]KSG46099.1 septum formation inhibitor Maf [Pseudomonas aeruginosa]KSP87338.1 septum formation inhibitor Maf [Pseudomonas aeruginosa]